MDLTSNNEQGVLTVRVTGRLDSTSASKFESGVNSLSSGSKTSVVVDMEKLEYISSAGLRAILLLTKAANANGSKLMLCALPSQVKEVFKISGFDKIIPIHGSKAEAISAIK